jgi:hypothetical protein
MPGPGPVPQWVRQLGQALQDATGQPLRCVAGGRASPVPWSMLVGWAVDAALFGRARGLCPVAAPHGGAVEHRPQDILVAVPEADPSRVARVLQLRAGGRPASELRQAVDDASRTGDGTLELQVSLHEQGALRRQIAWHAYLNERSRQRSFDLAADKLVRMAARMLADPLHLSSDSHAPGLPVGGRSDWRSPLARMLRHAGRRATMRDQWAITVFTGVPDDVLWPESPGIDLVPPDDRFWADPFVCRHEGGLWVFFEELPFATQRGHIAAVQIGEDGSVSPPRVVLREPCHLSYPNVFAHEGQWYMLPESGERRNIVLYRARAFPDDWEPVAELVSGLRTADATLHHDGARWWMSCSAASERGCIYDELHLFSASALAGPWAPSPFNPVRVDPSSARPAGPWFRYRGSWVRPAQDCRRRYGRATQLLAVRALDERGIRDEPLASLEAVPDAAVDAVHTYCRVGSDLAIDWLRWRPRLGGAAMHGSRQVILRSTQGVAREAGA